MRKTAAALVIALTLASCGGGDDDGQAETLSDPTTTTTDAPSDEEDGEAPDPADDGSAPSQEEMDSVVLQLADMPTGYSVSPPEEESEDDDIEDSCTQFEGQIPEPVVESEANYQADEFGPFIVSSAGWYEDAEALFDEFVGLAEQCREWSDTDEEGTVTNGTFSPMSFPSMGERTFALAVSADADGFTFSGQMVFVKINDHLAIAVFTFGFGGPSGVDIEPLVRTAIDRAS